MASNRRKRPFPVRLNNEEQQKLAWNMTDLMKNNGVAKSSSLFQDAASSSGLGFFSDEIKVEHIPKKRQRFMAKKASNCDEIVELKLQSNLPECWHCLIGSFGVSLHQSGNHSASTLESEENKTFPIPCANMAEVKLTLSMESIIDNEVGFNDFVTREGSSAKECLPSGLRTLSMKGSTKVPSETLSTLENLQKKGLVSLIINPKTSVFDDSWEIDVCLCEKALSKMRFASVDVMIRNNDKLIQNLMKFFFEGICDNGRERVEYWDKETEFTSLYETVMRRREEKGKVRCGKMKTFVAGNKSTNESCKLGQVCASELNMNGQIYTRNCEKFETNLTNPSAKSYVNCENKYKILDTELQSKEKPLILEEEDVSKPMEVQPECEHKHEVTGFLDLKPLCDFQHEHLMPTLRQYQRRAVQWMIDKENRCDSRQAIQENDLHVLWRRCVTLDKKVIFFNPFNGRLTTEHFKSPVLPTGGILADEMGLGKTVEVLACILNNPISGGETPKNDKDEMTAGQNIALVSRSDHLPESESKTQSRGFFSPSESSSQRSKPQEETSKAPEPIVPFSTLSPSSVSCSSELPPTSALHSVSPCASEVPSETISKVPEQIVSFSTISPSSLSRSSELPSTSVTHSVSPCTSEVPSETISKVAEQIVSFSTLSPSSLSRSSELPSTSVTHSVSPCTSEVPSETISKVAEQIVSFSTLSPSLSRSSELPSTSVTHSVSPCTSEVPSETISKVAEQIVSFSTLSPSSLSRSSELPSTSVTHSVSPCTSEVPSETVSKVPEQIVSFSTSSPSFASCIPELPSTCTPMSTSFTTSVFLCTSEVSSVTRSPSSVISHKLPERPSAAMAPTDKPSTSSSIPSTTTPASMKASDTTSVLPSIPSAPPTELILSSKELIPCTSMPSSDTTSVLPSITSAPPTELVLSSKVPIPCTSMPTSDTTSVFPSIPSAPPTELILSSKELIPYTSMQPSDTTSVLPSTPTTTPYTQLILSSEELLPLTSMAPSDKTLVPSTPSATPHTQMAFSSTTLQSTLLAASSTTSILPSLLSTTPSVALSSSPMLSRLPIQSQNVSSLAKSSASVAQSITYLQSTCVSPTSLVCPSKPLQNCSCPSSMVHAYCSSETETSAAKARNMELNVEQSPQEGENLLEPKQLCTAESSDYSSSLQCHKNDTNIFANSNKNGSSPSLGLENVVPVSNTTMNFNARTAPSTKNDHITNVEIRGKVSRVHTGSRPATLTIKCVCGSTRSSIDDVLLKCTDCSTVSHASCLGHSTTYHPTEDFLCPNCAVNRPPITSRATLIISPATIAHQWVEEITRHTTPSALRLLVYEGVAKQGFVQPDMLADHDVILTTYATLRADFHHLGTQQGRSLRYQKRYMALPSPLTAIKFWRICLDEAQMVESTTAKAAEMALRLDCVNRWCVTGTPIQKGLEDLYGLLLFLGVYPYCQKVWWNKLLYGPYVGGNKEPMYNALTDILWRTAKKDVLDEINLPSQTEVVVRLNFTPVEEHFYRRQQEECSASINLMLRRFGSQDIKLNSLDRNTVHRMLIPLLRLRQACCHPQVVRGGFLSMQKSTMTMEQLLEVLITRAKLECEEAHRQLLFAINGLAGIHAIKEEWPEAVDLYRQSMQSWVEHEDKFRTDALQKLHTLHNLSDLLSAGHPGCSHTLRDDKLKDEAEELVKQYMTKPNTQVQAAIDNLTVAQKNIEELLKKVQFQTPWWLLAADSVESSGLGHELINRVREELSAVSTDHSSILNSFTDMHGLGFTVTTKLDVVESTHSTLVQALDQLRSYPTPEMVHATAACCLRSRPNRTSQATKCKFCEVDDIFTEYESRLFGHQGMKGIIEEEEASNIDWHRHGNTGGLRAETETEKALKTFFAFIKSHRLVPSVHQDARNHLTFMEARRKEFKFLRSVWFASRERVSALDELEMCTTKLRLALPGETVNEDEKHVIQRGQVEQQKLKFISDRIIARTELRKKLGQYLYLTNLAKSQKFNEGENPDPCPVCTKNLGKEWSVFSCGHCYCCQCVWVLLRQAGIGPRNRDIHIKCPICRFPTLAREISYVCTGKDGNHGDKSISVKGSHSTKVEAVVRALLKIKAEDETVKCLVFSTWQDVLELIGKALQENDVNFRHITCGGKRFQTDLHVFKEDDDVPVLLLPLQSGSNGLNIIEATHVLLVEPALNPAHELQAVGRVHRIGQTRPTFVHRFIINNTVESRMHSLLNGKSRDVVRTGSKDTENSTLTIADLTSLFKEGNDPNQMDVDSAEHDDIEMIT